MASTANSSIKNIFSVPGKALKAKKLIVLSLFLIIAVVIYNSFGYLAAALDRPDTANCISDDGFVPLQLISFNSSLAQFIFYLGILLSIFSIMTGFMAVSIFDFEKIRGNRFFSISDSLKFTRSRIKPLFLSETAILIFIGFIILLGILIGLISRIPFFGPILYSLFFLFPNFIVSLFTILIAMVLVLSVLVMPIAVTYDAKGEYFNSILETFATIIKRPVHWALFTSYSILAAKIAGFIFGYLSFRTVKFMEYSTGLGGGEKIKALISSGINHLPFDSRTVNFMTNLFPGINFGFDIPPLAAHGADNGIAGYIMAISLFLIFILIGAYILSVIATGQAQAFLIIKKLRHGSIDSIEK
jgi:hypothetical protein